LVVWCVKDEFWSRSRGLHLLNKGKFHKTSQFYLEDRILFCESKIDLVPVKEKLRVSLSISS